MIHGRGLFEIGAHLRIALVAVLDAAEIAAVCLGVFEEGDQVGHADDGQSATDLVVVVGGDGPRHVSAVAAAGDHDLAGVEGWLRADPVEQRADVFVGLVAVHAVVAGEEGLAVSGGPADVGEDDCDAEFIEEVVGAPEESGAGLAFGAAMNVNDHRTLA